MPGFFDLFFRPAESEPEPPKPKKVKKAKKAKKPKEDTSLVDSLRSDIAELREMVTPHSSHIPEEELEEEPEEEPHTEEED